MTTIKTNGTTINFLDFNQKVVDSRSEIFKNKFTNGSLEKKYWIGIVRLDNIRKTGDQVTICFIEAESKRLTADYYYQRGTNSLGEKVFCGYKLPTTDIYQCLWEAREKGYKFFHMFLEESCSEVKLLCLFEERYKYGFPLKVLFTNLSKDKIKWLSEMKRTDFQTELVLDVGPYH